MPTPSVQTRMMLSSLPCEAARPAATPSASFRILTWQLKPSRSSACVSSSPMRAPLNCGRFGASSTTPLRMSPAGRRPPRRYPGAPRAPPSPARRSSSPGLRCAAPPARLVLFVLRKRTQGAFQRWSTTSPAITRSDNTTPMVFAMWVPPCMCLAVPLLGLRLRLIRTCSRDSTR